MKKKIILFVLTILPMLASADDNGSGHSRVFRVYSNFKTLQL